VILCVCLNPSTDVTYAVTELTYGASHHVEVVGRRAGGKAINVARVLHQLGEPVLATGLVGGVEGSAVRADLAAAGIGTDLVEIQGESRRTVTVYDGRDATVLNEVGPVVCDSEWRAFLARYAGLLADATVVVISGSQPPGVPADGYARLTELAVAAGVTVVLDAAGPALRAALAARPDVVKPNGVELGELLGRTLGGPDDVLAACRTLVEDGAGAALASLGADGLVAVTPAGSFRVQVPSAVTGNPTGAGDALTAAVTRGLRRGDDWPTCLAHGVAVAAASVSVDLAGSTDEALAAALLPAIRVEEIG